MVAWRTQHLFPRPGRTPGGVGNTRPVGDLLSTGRSQRPYQGRQPGDPRPERSSQRQIRCYLRENLSESSLPGLEPGQKEKQMASPRPRPQVIRLTDAAAERIKFVMANAVEPVVAVRVGVKNGGCAGMAYTMEYAERVEKADEVVEDKGVRVLIDPKAVLFLLGTEMDYKTDKLAAQFVFNNPNQTSACGCGESVQLKPAANAH